MNSPKISKAEIEHLAKLSRLSLDASELASFEKDFDAILSYVSEIKDVKTGAVNSNAPLAHNVMREDVYVERRGVFTEKLLKNAPQVEDGFISVTQIFE